MSKSWTDQVSWRWSSLQDCFRFTLHPCVFPNLLRRHWCFVSTAEVFDTWRNKSLASCSPAEPSLETSWCRSHNQLHICTSSDWKCRRLQTQSDIYGIKAGCQTNQLHRHQVGAELISSSAGCLCFRQAVRALTSAEGAVATFRQADAGEHL